MYAGRTATAPSSVALNARNGIAWLWSSKTWPGPRREDEMKTPSRAM
jgi:hypothetical protein